MSRLPEIAIRAQGVGPAFRGALQKLPTPEASEDSAASPPRPSSIRPPPPRRPQPRRRLLGVGFGPRGAPAGAGHSPSVRSGAGPGGARSGSARVLETALRRYIAPRLAALQPLLPRALRGASSPGRAPPRGGASAAPQPRLGGRGDR